MISLTRTANDKEVVYDEVQSHVATHFADTPQLHDLAKEVLSGRTLTEDTMLFDADLDRIVGTTDLVENKQGDTIIYAKRLNRDIYTAFNMTQSAQPCSYVTVCVKKINDSTYELVSAWIGPADSPPFPGDPNEAPNSKIYWNTHSLAWGTQEIQPGTETNVCPW